MRIRLQPCDYSGCGQYRLRWPSAALAAMGVDVEPFDHWPEGRYLRNHGQTTAEGRLLEVMGVEDVDVIVMQRPMMRTEVEAIGVLQSQGIAVVVEIDDDFHALPAGHPAKVDTSSRVNPDFNRGWLRRACQKADLVTVSTPALAERYGAHGRVHLLPNCIPARYLDVRRDEHDGVLVGWTGSTVTHVDDLRVCGDGVRLALDDSNAQFHCIGVGRGVAEQLELSEPFSRTGWVEIDDYPAHYASLDVAIVPLQPNPFNEAKSWLKGIEAAALGVPFVASPTSPYMALAQFGAGGLADTPEQWRAQVGLLASHAELRAEVAECGRQVAARFTIEGNAWRWLEAWERAVQIRRTGSVSVLAG